MVISAPVFDDAVFDYELDDLASGGTDSLIGLEDRLKLVRDPLNDSPAIEALIDGAASSSLA